MTFTDTADNGITVTTWRLDENGNQIWRARLTAETFVEFPADRLTEVEELFRLGRKALELE